MFKPNSITDSLIDADSESKPERPRAIKVISIIAALAVTAALLIGFLIWRNYHAQKVISAEQAHSKPEAAPALPAKLQVYMDEAVRKGPQALVSGTVHNISNETISNVVIEMELTHRKDGNREQRSLEVEPKELAPDQKGRYSMTLTGDYRSYKVLRIKTGARAEEVGFKTTPGVPRPYEAAPETTRTVIITRPSQPKKGEEFINTPDNPARIP